MEGWSQLGKNMFGNSEAAYQRGVGLGQADSRHHVDLQSKLFDTRKKRDEEIARGQFMQKLVAMGETPERADAIATWQIGGGNPGQLSQAMLGMQEHGQRGELWDRVSGGAGIPEVNPLLAALKGESVDLTKISGGVAYNPMATPDMAQVTATPVGESQILAQNARANQSNAAAGAQAALARLNNVKADAGGFAPKAVGNGGITNTDLSMLDLLMPGKPDEYGDANPDTVAQGEFLEWQARQTHDPRMKDVRYAVSEFKRQRDTGMGQFFDGSGSVPARVDLSQGGGVSAPAAGPAPRARNPATGEVLELRNGQWVPVQ